MELQNQFEVAVPVDEAWVFFTDVERIAPCLPGAELQEVDGDEYRGIVKVKVGPVTTEYRGVARFLKRDEQARTVVLSAEGRETRGQGNASATITASLEPSERGTRVSVTTDLSITGKAAQFGRGVLADVSTKLLGQFVENLEATVLNTAAEAPLRAGGASDSERSADAPVRRIGAPNAEPVDLFKVVARPIARRLLPMLGAMALAVIAVVVRRFRTQRKS